MRKNVVDDRQHDRDRVGQPHRDQTVVADQKIANDGDGDIRCRSCGGGVDYAVEDAVLEEADEQLCAEDADEDVGRIQHESEDGNAGERLSNRAVDRLARAARRHRVDAAERRGGRVRPVDVADADPSRHLRSRCRRQCLPKLRHAASFGCHGLDHGNPEMIRQAVRVDRDPARMRLVDHVQDEDHRQARLRNLRREHQCPAEIAGIGNLNDQLGASALEKALGDSLVLAQRAFQRVHAWRVDDVADFGADERAAGRDRHRRARIIRHGRIASGESSEHDALADVRVTDQGDFERVGAESQYRGLTGRQRGARAHCARHARSGGKGGAGVIRAVFPPLSAGCRISGTPRGPSSRVQERSLRTRCSRLAARDSRLPIGAPPVASAFRRN